MNHAEARGKREEDLCDHGATVLPYTKMELLTSTFDRLHRVVKVYVVVFVFWGIYRLVFRLPEIIEETFFKPLVFVGTVLVVERPKRWDRFFVEVWGRGDWAKALGLGLGFGLVYLMFYGLSSFLAFGRLQVGSPLADELWSSFVSLGLLTAVWEEWLFAGYLFGQLRRILKSPMSARLITATLFALIHFPILAFGYKFTGTTLGFQLLLLAVLGFSNTILIGFSKNLLAPIASHALWGVAIFLFR